MQVFRPVLGRRLWICAQCLHKQRRRGLVGVAAAQADEYTAPKSPPPSYYSRSSDDTDDTVLQKIFDSPSFWKEFSFDRSHGVAGRRTGLLQNQYLTSPEGFKRFSSNALEKCRKIVSKVLAAESTQDYKSVTRDLDRLSDQLCRVIDLVDFIRNVHPDPRIQQAASQAHSLMYDYMNVLNTTKGLDDQLRKASSIPEVTSGWTEEEAVTARILLKDFAQSAITASDDVKQKFVQLSNDVVQVGTDMLEEMRPAKYELMFNSKKLKGMDPMAVKRITSWGNSRLPTHGPLAELALRTVENPDVRREIYMANRTASKDSVERVERLLQSRAELAQLSGHESFAHMTLSDKMAKTPEAVNQFLKALAANNQTTVREDLGELLDIKNADAHEAHFPDRINAWDRGYYTRLRRAQLYPLSGGSNRQQEILSSYFSLGSVFQGLSKLFSRLYGIRLVPRATLPGEAWNDDVRRLDVIDENEGHIAVLYCDLFARPNKSPNPAHFTLRCSREITAAELEDSGPQLPASASSDVTSLADLSLEDLSAALNDGMALNRDAHTGKIHQLPTIAFICDFPRPSPSTSGNAPPTLLSLRQLSTLFHEMGHALHSMLGRTTLQNVAGTRCATDFAELPSILMEYFASAPEVLRLYARHWETGAPLNVNLVGHELAANRRLLASQETEAQILFSVLDQRYHDSSVPPLFDSNSNSSTKWSSTATYHSVFTDPRFTSTPEPPGTSWQGFFGHLFGYGAVYYSYLFDRAIASRVWADVFAENPLARRSGQQYRDEVLKWGGGRDGWACVAGVLGPEKAWMKDGGEKAMKEVGKWGVGGEGGAGAPM